MKNRPTDLVDHLMAQAERLRDEGLSTEELEQEIKRSKALCDLGDTIIGVHTVQVNAFRVAHEAGLQPNRLPLPIGHEPDPVPGKSR